MKRKGRKEVGILILGSSEWCQEIKLSGWCDLLSRFCGVLSFIFKFLLWLFSCPADYLSRPLCPSHTPSSIAPRWFMPIISIISNHLILWHPPLIFSIFQHQEIFHWVSCLGSNDQSSVSVSTSVLQWVLGLFIWLTGFDLAAQKACRGVFLA